MRFETASDVGSTGIPACEEVVASSRSIDPFAWRDVVYFAHDGQLFWECSAMQDMVIISP